MYYKFQKDLERAEKTELLVLTLLKTLGFQVKRVDKEHQKEYDLYIKFPVGDIPEAVKSKKINERLIEIKEEFYTYISDNVGFEYSYKGFVSGILATKSDYWIHIIHTKNEGIILMIFDTKKLKSELQFFEHYKRDNIGDNGNSKMYIIPKDKVFSFNSLLLKQKIPYKIYKKFHSNFDEHYSTFLKYIQKKYNKK